MVGAPVELWMIVGGIAAAFVLVTLRVIARWLEADESVRLLRAEVTTLRSEYARRTEESEIVEAEEARLEAIVVPLIEPEKEAA
jgi:hypothetical protein